MEVIINHWGTSDSFQRTMRRSFVPTPNVVAKESGRADLTTPVQGLFGMKPELKIN